MPPRWVLLTLLCLALIVRARFMLSMGHTLEADPDWYRELSWNVYLHRTFGVEADGTLWPTAFRPPLYPVLLSFLHGFGEHGYYGEGILHVLLGVATVWAVWRSGLAWGLPPGGAILAAALVTIDPILLNQSVHLMSETLATMLSSFSLLALSRAARQTSIAWSLGAGAMLGLCALCRPTFLVWLIGVSVAWPVMISRGSTLLRSVALTAGAVAVLAPWAVRNVFVFERPIVTTTHGGYTLLLGNNPSFYEFLRAGAWGSLWDAREFNARHDDGLPALWGPSEPLGDQLAYEEAWGNIRAEPAMFVYACLVREGRLWGVLPHALSAAEAPSRRGLRYAVAVFYLFELPLAGCGVWFLRRRLVESPVVWGVLLVLSFVAVHALYWADLRMRAPLAGTVAILATFGVVQWLGCKHDATHSPEGC
jgi:hypothetical protein